MRGTCHWEHIGSSLRTHCLVSRNTLSRGSPCLGAGSAVAANRFVAMDKGDLLWLVRTGRHRAVLKLQHARLVAGTAGRHRSLALLYLGSLLPLGVPLALIEVERAKPLHRELGLSCLLNGKIHQIAYRAFAIAQRQLARVCHLFRRELM